MTCWKPISVSLAVVLVDCQCRRSQPDGARVVLFERHKMGGDCLNYGCVPSKALLAAAKLAYQPSQAKARVSQPSIGQYGSCKPC